MVRSCVVRSLLPIVLLVLAGCSSGGGRPVLGSNPVPPPAPSCAASPGGGSSTVATPTLQIALGDGVGEGWLASPAVADLDGDAVPDILLAREGALVAFHADGSTVWQASVDGRIWASPVVADFLPAEPGLETAVAARDTVHLFDATGAEAPGFPRTWRDELRTIAGGDVDGDGSLEIVVVTTTRLDANGQSDIVLAYEANGDVVFGFPPNTTGQSGCDAACYVTGGYDQNLALGDVDQNGIVDILAPHDNAYMSLHDGTGRAFDCAPIFEGRTKFPGVRFLLDYVEAQAGYSDTEATSLQAHFTNSAPAVVDVDEDGRNDLVVLGSVQNVAQTDRERGVVLFALHDDGTRLSGWEAPFHAPDFLAGLWDYDGTNVVAATNQVSVADLFGDAGHAGPEFVFAGFDGRIHCVDARASEIWNYQYTTSTRVLTAGVLVADLSGDGAAELIFASYSPDDGQSELFVLDGGGNELARIALPGRGAMAAPSVANVDGDAALEIVVPLKDGSGPLAQVYEVSGSEDNCLVWPTGRANLLRNGYVP